MHRRIAPRLLLLLGLIFALESPLHASSDLAGSIGLASPSRLSAALAGPPLLLNTAPVGDLVSDARAAMAGPGALPKSRTAQGSATAGSDAAVVGRRIGNDTLPLALIGAGLVVLPFDKKIASSICPDHQGNSFSKNASRFGAAEILLPTIAGVYLMGKEYDRQSAGMALSALVSTGIITQGVKMLTGRVRPVGGSEEGKFTGPGIGKGGSSFPSGHTAAAFAVATVLANRYPNDKWLLYGLASMVGYARIRGSAHFPSDVLVGAGLGMDAGHQALNHRMGMFSFRFK